VRLKRMTLKRPEKEKMTSARTVAPNGTWPPRNALKRTIAMGRTVIV